MGAQDVKIRRRQGRYRVSARTRQDRQPPRTKAAMTERDGEPHKVDYAKVGFETVVFFLAFGRVTSRI